MWSPGPAPTADQARPLEWELVVPSPDDVVSAVRSLRDAGYTIDDTGYGVRLADPWGIEVRLRIGEKPATHRRERTPGWQIVRSRVNPEATLVSSKRVMDALTDRPTEWVR